MRTVCSREKFGAAARLEGAASTGRACSQAKEEVDSFSGGGRSHMAQVCKRLPAASGNVAAAAGAEHLLALER